MQEPQKLHKAWEFFKEEKYAHCKRVIQEILQKDKHNTKAKELLAYALGNEGRITDAIRLLEVITKNTDASNESLYYLGVLYSRSQNYEEAIKFFENAITKVGFIFEILFELGNAYAKIQNFKNALLNFERAHKLKPDSIEVLYNIGKIYEILKNKELAKKFYEKTISINPNYINALQNYGVCLYESGNYQKALDCYSRIISINPEAFDIWTNIGNTQRQLGSYKDAIRSYNRAISINQNDVSAIWNKALSLLLEGNYSEGWALYSYRWKLEGFEKYRHEEINQLDKLENLHGKKILVWHEQGFGDVIQFIRYLPLLLKTGAEVTIEIQKPLISLMEKQFPCKFIEYVAEKNFDYQIPITELAKLFQTTVENIPFQEGYIHIQSKDSNVIKDRYIIDNKKINIGMAISGNINHQNDINRSIPLREFISLDDSMNYYLLQKDIREDDKVALDNNCKFIFLGNAIKNFHETANIIDNLDLIVTVDTSLAHLALAMGKKTVVLLPFSPDWRWGLISDKSKWYKSAKLIRQEKIGDWKSVVDNLKKYISNIGNV